MEVEQPIYPLHSKNLIICFYKVQILFMSFLDTIKTDNITIVFVSDGEDSNLNTIDKRLSEIAEIYRKIPGKKRTVHFMCVAVGK